MRELRPQHTSGDDFFILHKTDFIPPPPPPPPEPPKPAQQPQQPRWGGRTTDDEEALMREWAAMAGGRDDDDDTDFMEAEREAMLGGGSDNPEDNMPRVSIRVLNQDEIDSLLGFDDYSTRENLLINGLDENGNPVEVNGMEEGGDPEVREYERGFAK